MRYELSKQLFERRVLWPFTPPFMTPRTSFRLSLLWAIGTPKDCAVRLFRSTFACVVGHSTSSHPNIVTAGTLRPSHIAPNSTIISLGSPARERHHLIIICIFSLLVTDFWSRKIKRLFVCHTSSVQQTTE